MAQLQKISIQIYLFKRVLRTRGRLRWLCYRLMVDNFPDAYEISRGRLLLRIFMKRNIFKELILSRLFVSTTKSDSCQSISAYDYTHPDIFFRFKKSQVYLLEDNLNAPLVFKHKDPELNFHGKLHVYVLERLILWNSSRILSLMQLSPTFIDNPEIQSFMSSYPDLMAQYNSSERFHVVFHEHSAKTLSERRDESTTDPDLLLNVEVWHQRFILQRKRWIVTDITGSPYTKFVAGHWQFLEQAKNEGADVFIKRPSSATNIRLKAAINLMGRADENWYHLLLDTLPRYLYLKDIDQKIPILVRSDLPKSSLKFLSRILDREIIYVKPEEVVSIDKLFLIAARSTTFDSRPANHIEQVKFPTGIYPDLQSYILGKLSNRKVFNYPKKLYLPRKSKYRNLVNESRVTNLASNSGYSVIDSNLDFYERQFHYFNRAETVLSPGGAVLANTVFMKPESRVLLIRSWRDSDLLLWKKLSEACGVHFKEAIGVPTYYGRNALARQHSSFYLPLRRIRKIIKSSE